MPALPFQPFWEAFMEADARTEFNFCKKGMKKKHCKMDIGRENNAWQRKHAFPAQVRTFNQESKKGGIYYGWLLWLQHEQQCSGCI